MTDDKKRTYESATLGVPALKMVLVHARNEAQRSGLRAGEDPEELGIENEKPLDKAQVVKRIIKHLKES